MILYTGSQIETEWDLNCLFVYAEKTLNFTLNILDKTLVLLIL